jgi:hypothetical protein
VDDSRDRARRDVHVPREGCAVWSRGRRARRVQPAAARRTAVAGPGQELTGNYDWERGHPCPRIRNAAWMAALADLVGCELRGRIQENGTLVDIDHASKVVNLHQLETGMLPLQ